MSRHAEKNPPAKDHPYPLLSERRVVGHALNYWMGKRNDKEFPSHTDIKPGDVDEALWAHFFTVDLRAGVDKCKFTFAGDIISSIREGNPQGQLAADWFPPSLWETLYYSFTTSAATRKPITASGEFITLDQADALHRSIVMPLANDGDNIGFLLGAFSFRFNPDN